MSRKTFFNLLKVGLGLFLVWMLWKTGLVAPARVLGAFQNSPQWVALALIFHTTIFVGLGYRWVMIARAAGFPLPLGLGQKLTFVGHFFSSIFPGNGAGEVAKAWILSRHELRDDTGSTTLRNPDGTVTEVLHRSARPTQMGMAQAIGTMIPDRLTGMTGLFTGWATCLGLCIVQTPTHATVLLPFFLFAVAMAIALLAGLFVLPRLSLNLQDRLSSTRWSRFLGPVNKGLESLRQSGASRPTLVRALGLSLGIQTLFYLACFACAKALGYTASLVTLGATMPLAALSNSIPATPGGVGIGEGVAAGALQALGHTPQVGAEIMFLLRLVLWFIALAGFVVWLTLRRETPKGMS
ncbi:MAG: hypothetical protein RL318_635 [Fibrobacterota bacterium]|jgi:uncharacterized membrane protein YbhN (UPF0104 family)